MSLEGIISISGRPGVFRVVAQGKNNVIVESLLDKKRFPAYASERISALEDISIFTTEGDVKLTEVYEKMLNHYKGEKSIGHKEDLSKLENELQIFVPKYDKERVYNSDIKKLFQWYNLLIDKGLLKWEQVENKASDKGNEEKELKKESKKPSTKAKASSTKTSNVTAKSKSTTTKATGSKKVSAPKTGSSRGK